LPAAIAFRSIFFWLGFVCVKSMKILVTGAAGYLGRATVQALVAEGHEVVGTDRRPPNEADGNFRVADLLAFGEVAALMQGVGAVVHLGNHPHVRAAPPQRVYGENCAMNINVFHAAAEAGVSAVIFASSIQAVATGPTAGGGSWRPSYLPFDSWMPHDAGNVYAASKVAGEDLLGLMVRRGLSCGVALRFPRILAVEERERLRREPPPAKTSPEVLYVWRERAAELIAALVRAQPPGFHALLPAESAPPWNASPEETRLRYFPEVPLRGCAAPLDSLVDLSAIRALVDWEPWSVTPDAAGV
jgi:nucleoside-diphosphate-sugar epimerase